MHHRGNSGVAPTTPLHGGMREREQRWRVLTTETCKAAKKHKLKRGTQVTFWTFTAERSSSRGRMESIDTNSNVDNTLISA